MKIIIISDIHDNLVNLKKCLAWAENHDIKGTICCGDVVNSETLEFLDKKAPRPFYLISGNMEIFEPQEVNNLANINYLGRSGVCNFGERKIGLAHEPAYANKLLSEHPDLDIIFYGHTHKPWLEKRNGVELANPGTLGAVFQKATFATYDTGSGKLELHLLEDLKN